MHKTTILCQFGNSQICPNFANPSLTQFSSISGENCIKLQATKHDSGKQLLQSGVLQDDADNDITTSWIFNQTHVVHDHTHLETRHGGRLPMEWVLLDNQSTIDVFVNRRLLRNIRRIN